MARPEITGRKVAGSRKRAKVPSKLPLAGKSPAQFCETYGISRSTFEEWRRRGLGPAELQPIRGGRIIISAAAEAEWLAKRSALAAVADPAN
jgi:hypothetical protein